jgi:hypothetical protein
VPAGIIRLDFMPTMVALGDMAAQGGRATERDGTQGSVLLTRQDVAIALEKRGLHKDSYKSGHRTRMEVLPHLIRAVLGGIILPRTRLIRTVGPNPIV